MLGEIPALAEKLYRLAVAAREPSRRLKLFYAFCRSSYFERGLAVGIAIADQA